MKHDPFGSLVDWWNVLEIFEDLVESDGLSECQSGLIRILRYKGNWRLREQVLQQVGTIRNPSDDLIHQVLAILDDDTIYYDARILAGEALMQLLRNIQINGGSDVCKRVQKVVRKLRSAPQPLQFDKTLNRLYSNADAASMNEN